MNIVEAKTSLSIDTHVEKSLSFMRSRNFNYNLNLKAAKNKIIKGAQRTPFEIEANTTSSNIVFSLGAWFKTVLPSIAYWSSIAGDVICDLGD